MSYEDRKQPKAIVDLYSHGIEMSKYLNINCVADINNIIQCGRFKQLILIKLKMVKKNK